MPSLSPLTWETWATPPGSNTKPPPGSIGALPRDGIDYGLTHEGVLASICEGGYYWEVISDGGTFINVVCPNGTTFRYMCRDGNCVLVPRVLPWVPGSVQRPATRPQVIPPPGWAENPGFTPPLPKPVPRGTPRPPRRGVGSLLPGVGDGIIRGGTAIGAGNAEGQMCDIANQVLENIAEDLPGLIGQLNILEEAFSNLGASLREALAHCALSAACADWAREALNRLRDIVNRVRDERRAASDIRRGNHDLRGGDDSPMVCDPASILLAIRLEGMFNHLRSAVRDFNDRYNEWAQAIGQWSINCACTAEIPVGK